MEKRLLVVGVAAGLTASCGRGSLDHSQGVGTIPPFADSCAPVGTPGTLSRVRATGDTTPSLHGPFGPCRLLLSPGSASSSVPTALWLSDGTPDGTQPVDDDFNWGFDFKMVGRTGLFSTMWRTDGTAVGSFELADGLHMNNAASSLADTALLHDVLLFVASTDRYTDPVAAQHGYELWRTDGTKTGTFIAAELADGPDPTLFGPTGLVTFNDAVLFSDSKGDLWRSDGTAAGTRRIAPVRKRASAVLGDALLFVGAAHDAAGAVTTVGLWRTDGSEAGTTLLQDLGAPNAAHASFYVETDIFALAPLGNQMIVLASPGPPAISPETGTKFPPGPPIDAVWISDGSVAGTRLLAELPEFERYDTDFDTRVANGFVFFLSSSGREKEGRNLWRTDGTPAGTIALAPHAGYVGGVADGARVFFKASTPETGLELWASDGTPESTHLVKDINPGSGNAFPTTHASITAGFAGGRVLFSADDGAHGPEPWVSDGSATGTLLLGDLNPGSAGSAVGGPVTMNGAVYFTAASAPGDFWLWRFVPPQ